MTNILIATFVVGCAASLCKIGIDKYRARVKKTSQATVEPQAKQDDLLANPVPQYRPIQLPTQRVVASSFRDQNSPPLYDFADPMPVADSVRYYREPQAVARSFSVMGDQPSPNFVSIWLSHPYTKVPVTLPSGMKMTVRILPGKSNPNIFYACQRWHRLEDHINGLPSIQCWKKMDKGNWVGSCPVCDYAKAWRKKRLHGSSKLPYEKCETKYLYNAIRRLAGGYDTTRFFLCLSQEDHQAIMSARWRSIGHFSSFYDIKEGRDIELNREELGLAVTFGEKKPAHHDADVIKCWMDDCVDPLEFTNNQPRPLSSDQIVECVERYHIGKNLY